MPDSSPSPAAPASYGSRDAVPAHASSAVNRPQKRRVRLPHAEADLNFAAPLQHQTRQRSRKIQEIPANADVAQLVEHFTRNEGVPGSSPGVGFRWICSDFDRAVGTLGCGRRPCGVHVSVCVRERMRRPVYAWLHV